MKSITKINFSILLQIVFLVTTLGFAFITSSCEKTIEMDIEDDRRKIVVNSFFSPDEKFLVHLSRSRHILDNSQFTLLNNANVKLYKNGTFYSLLNNAGNGNYESDSIPEINSTYKIIVESDGLENVEAEGYAPAPVQILQIDTATILRNPYGYMEGGDKIEQLQLRMRIKG